MGRGLGGLLQLVARREQVLDGVVVQGLGERLTLALLGCQRVHHEALPCRGELVDAVGSTFEDRRKEHRGQADPGEVTGADRDEPVRVRTACRRVQKRLDEEGHERRRGCDRRERRAESECHGDRHEEEGKRRRRVGAAGEDGQRGDGRNVGGGHHERESPADPAAIDVQEHGGGEPAEDAERDVERRRRRVRVRQRFADGQERNSGEPKPGDTALGLGHVGADTVGAQSRPGEIQRSTR